MYEIFNGNPAFCLTFCLQLIVEIIITCNIVCFFLTHLLYTKSFLIWFQCTKLFVCVFFFIFEYSESALLNFVKEGKEYILKFRSN